MNFPGYNPSMLNNMSPEQMKTTADMLENMSDDQLRDYARMAGMPQMDPQMMRQSANMMRNMDSGQFNNIKNMAQNFNPAAGASTNNTSYGNNSSTQSVSSEKYKKIEKLKEKGNKHFKAQEYKDASSSYLEAIIEIEEIKSENRGLKDTTLDNLEISCRLNYANVKAKEEDFEIVLAQSRAVLNIKENGKAYFRLGQALKHFKKYEEAKRNLEKAMPLLPGDEVVVELYEEIKQAIKATKKTKIDDIEDDDEDYSYKPSAQDEEREEDKNTDSSKENGPKGKMKKKNTPGVEAPNIKDEKKTKKNVEEPYDYISNTKKNKSEVRIEEEEASESRPAAPQSNNRTPGYPHNISEEAIQKGKSELGNMNPDQMRMMTDYFKNMDNSSLKSMLRGQMGMDISDSQLEMMKSMMSPEMLQNFSKMDMSSLPRPGAGFPPQAGASAGATTQAGSMPSFSMGAGLGGANPMLDMKADQINGMFDMMIGNPEMLKGMVGMLGENNPIAKMIKNKKPEDLAKYLKVFKKMFKAYTKVSPAISFLRRHWQIFGGAFVGYIIYRMFG